MKLSSKLRFTLAGSFLLMTSSIALGGQLVVFDEDGGGGNPRGLYDVDKSTGVLTLRTTVAGSTRWFSMDQRPSDGNVFAAQISPGGELWSMDPDAGTFSSGVAHSLPTIADITTDPTTGTVYGLGRNSPFNLHTIDPVTGASTLIGPTGNGVRTGLTFSPSGVLYGFTLSGALYTIDSTSGASTFIGDSGASFGLIEDADFDDNGDMYIVDWGGLIGRVDPNTGARTLISTTGMGSGLTAVVFIDGGTGFATPFCYGDGTAAACPCGNTGAQGEGCVNSSGMGAMLAASGTASVASDDLALFLTQGPAGVPAICFSGTLQANGGLGNAFGDGLLCAGGTITRLGVRFLDGSGSGSWGPGLAAQGGWAAGDTRHIQGWFRDVNGSVCGAGFNTSHALSVTFQP